MADRPMKLHSSLPALSFSRIVGIASPLAGTYAATLGAWAVLLMSVDIGAALGATADEASWLVTAYLMAEMLVIPFAVYLALAVSMRRLMMLAAAGFTLVSALSATAETFEGLLALRVAHGITGGLFSPLSFMIILRTFTDRGRHEGLAGLSFAVIAPIAVAGMLGGLALEHADWRLVFWVQTFLGVLVFIMAFLGVPSTPGNRSLLAELDWRGYALFIIGFPALLMVLTQGERSFWFEDPLIIVGATIATVTLLALVVHEIRAPRPFVDVLILFRRPNFGGVMFLHLFFRFGILVTAFVGAQFLARVQGFSLVELATLLPWMALPQLVTFPLVYALAKRVDPRLTLTIGLALFALAAWINANLTADWASEQYRLSLLILAFAEPLFMISMTYEGVYGIQPSEGATATTLFNVTRSVGDAAGVAVLATLITEREKFHSSWMTEHLSVLVGESHDRFELALERFSSIHADTELALLQATRLVEDSVRVEAYVAAYNDAFLLIAGIMILATALSLLLPKVPDITAGGRPGARP